MRLAIIAMQASPAAGKNQDYWQELKNAHYRHAAEQQIVALARHMRDGGTLAPLLICHKGSALEKEANRLNLPCMAVKSLYNPGDMFRLWRWQRKHASILVVAAGNDSLDAAARLMGMRKKGTCKFIPAFLLSPPAIKRSAAKAVASASYCLCGSGFIRERIAESLQACSQAVRAEFKIQAPGIELDNYLAAPAWNGGNGRHFVFGMAESLQPRSGALLVVRAMSALWQKEDLPPWEVRMFGSGPRFAEIMEEASNLGVASKLAVLGDQKPEDVCRHCHAWLAPGSSPEELPHTLWDGFASGLPVICSQSELHRERLRDTPNAALRVEKNNPQEMARAMIGLMRDSRLRQRMVNASIKVKPEAGLSRMAEKISSLLETLADKPEKKSDS